MGFQGIAALPHPHFTTEIRLSLNYSTHPVTKPVRYRKLSLKITYRLAFKSAFFFLDVFNLQDAFIRSPHQNPGYSLALFYHGAFLFAWVSFAVFRTVWYSSF